jgi:hypothetical protein
MSEERFPILDVSGWEVIADETAGAEEKYWLQEPGTDERWLFKSVTVKGGHVHGEDWAEKAVAQLAGLLGVPCARIELAELRGSPGCIGADLRPPQYELQHGQILLEERKAPGYVHGKGTVHPGHTLENIRASLDGALPPPWSEFPFDATAYDVFAGYVLLDAWVANRDRHDNNWAVLRPAIASGGPLSLCGSYDHANGLGFNLTDDRCLLLAEQQRLATWCEKGTAWRFDHDPGLPIPTLVELAAKALQLASAEARRYWPERLAQVEQDAVRHVLAQVPRMSDPARTFAEKMLQVNRRRVLDACS